MDFSSHRSLSESHVTLLNNNMEPNTNSRSKFEDTLETITYYLGHQGKKLWVDRILGLFCVKSSNMIAKPETCDKLEVS